MGTRLKYSTHAFERMLEYGVTRGEVEETVDCYDTSVPARGGCVNRWKTFSGFRLRVTLNVATMIRSYDLERGRLMQRLIAITKEPSEPHSLYLRYDSAPVAKTVSLDGDEHYVNVDIAQDGDIVGIEVVFPREDSLALVAAFANEKTLELPDFLSSFAQT